MAERSPSPIRRLFLLEPGEGAPLLLSGGMFLLLMLGYYLLRPLREAMGIAKGADRLPWLMTGTLLAMLLVNPLFSWMVARWPRRRFVPWTYRILALSLLGFGLGFRALPGHGGVRLGYAFYIWLSVLNLFLVSLFWGYMADLWSEAQGRRLFGAIAVGGTLGALVGAALTEALSSGRFGVQAGPTGTLFLAVVFLEGAVQCGRALGRRRGLERGEAGAEPGPRIFEGLRLLARSPYLLLLCGYLLLYTVTSTFLYLQQGGIVARSFTGSAARAAAFARIDLGVNTLSLFGQLFLTGHFVKRLGLGAALGLLPLLTLLGFGALALWPVFPVLALVMVARRGLHYAVDRPVREMLYLPLGPEEKYKTKSFVDTFVYRTGDLLGVWAPGLLAAVGVPAALGGLGLSAAWAGVAKGLGKRTLRAS